MKDKCPKLKALGHHNFEYLTTTYTEGKITHSQSKNMANIRNFNEGSMDYPYLPFSFAIWYVNLAFYFAMCWPFRWRIVIYKPERTQTKLKDLICFFKENNFLIK